ncbi:MAG: hypothetical protein LBE20_02520 [Deltaproteobacteria bacterium]|jgi:hypothetical protein|nr:hypothetical protein [Deltaproteobacteria bacterium]
MRTIFDLYKRIFDKGDQPMAPFVITKTYLDKSDSVIQLIGKGFIPVDCCQRERTTRQKFLRLEIQQSRTYRLFWVVNKDKDSSEPLLYAAVSSRMNFFDCPSYVGNYSKMLQKVYNSVYEEDLKTYNKFVVYEQETAKKTLAIAMLSGLVNTSHELQDLVQDLILLDKGRKSIEVNSLIYYYELLMHDNVNFYHRCALNNFYKGVFLWKILLDNGYSLLDKLSREKPNTSIDSLQQDFFQKIVG